MITTTKKEMVLLPISDASRLLCVHVNTLRRWSDQGIIRAYHIGPRGDRRFWSYDVLNLKAHLQPNNRNSKW